MTRDKRRKDFRNFAVQSNEVGRGGASSKSINAHGALSDRSGVRISIVWRIAVTKHDRPHSKLMDSGLTALMFVYKSFGHENILPSVLMKQIA